MSLQAFVALRERRMFVLFVTTACSGIPPHLYAFICLSAQHDCIVRHNAILNCLVDLAVPARVTGEVIFVPHTRIGLSEPPVTRLLL